MDNKKNVLNQDGEESKKEVIEQEVQIEEITNQEETPVTEEIKEEIIVPEETPDETPEEIKEEIIVPEETPEETPEEDTDETPEEDTDETPEEDTDDDIDETPEEDTDDDIEEEVAPRTIQSLSKSEFRLFQRTGLMPK